MKNTKRRPVSPLTMKSVKQATIRTYSVTNS